MFLRGNWDRLLCVDGDMVLPPNTLTKLAEVKADIVYGLYCWRREPFHWNATWGTVDGYEPGDTISRRDGQAKRAWGYVRPVTGKGFGATLIKRRVVMQAKWYTTLDHLSDHWIATQANERGWSQVCHFGAPVGHIVHTNGQVRGGVWPTQEAPYHRIEGV